jgi:hypothetical protein
MGFFADKGSGVMNDLCLDGWNLYEKGNENEYKHQA